MDGLQKGYVWFLSLQLCNGSAPKQESTQKNHAYGSQAGLVMHTSRHKAWCLVNTRGCGPDITQHTPVLHLLLQERPMLMFLLP